jgi:hypothetical protein
MVAEQGAGRFLRERAEQGAEQGARAEQGAGRFLREQGRHAESLLQIIVFAE